MYKLLALFGTASAAAAAAPAPSPLAIVIDPAMEVFAKGVDALTEVSGWVLAVPQSLADAAVWWIDLNLGMPALIRDVLTGDSATLDKLVDLSVNISGIVFVVYVALCAINLFLSTAESIRDYHKGFLTLPKADSVLGVKIPKEIADMLNAVRGPVQSMLLDPVKKWKHKTIVPLEGGDGLARRHHRDGHVRDGGLPPPLRGPGRPRPCAAAPTRAAPRRRLTPHRSASIRVPSS
ncbi:hypothetical protein JL720_5409 [Aureococcus anophagefferens]|nr:hypothetical protein JL720_5409 [Aureococcus anophagefferens]